MGFSLTSHDWLFVSLHSGGSSCLLLVFPDSKVNKMPVGISLFYGFLNWCHCLFILKG